ncbi:C40 family peptidase [Streptomyces sp. SID13726]|uniref:C40 family peptidase n=1 Tax=Streptomyces sp. SID13726 TaxID=2706058 RepID=UPI001EF35A7E|nr:C40 family peptidase [Streptomyces sp. SID13726]
MASAALLSQSGSAAADEAPSRDEVSRRITNLYDRAENDSGTYNATRAAGTASSKRDRRGAATGGSRGSGGGRESGGSRDSGGDPGLDAIAKQWYGVARAKLGPTFEATLPSDRAPIRSAETRRPRPSEAPASRDQKPAERAVPELTARPMLALPAAPEPTPAPPALPAAPDQPPTWSTQSTPQLLTGTGEIPVVGTAGTPQLETGFPEYSAQPSTGFPEYGGQLTSGLPEYAPALTAAMPEYTPGLPDHTGQFATGLPEYAPQATTGYPVYGDQLTTGFPDYTAQVSTGFPDYGGQLTTGLPQYTAPATTGFPEYGGQLTTAVPEYPAYPDYGTGTGTPLATLAPPITDGTQAVPVIPAPRAPEPQWQTPQPQQDSAPAPAPAPVQAAAPAPPFPSLPAPDPGYDSKVIQVLAFARSQIGKPCVWGAAGPGSYDNSGLTQAAWKVAGVSLPRTALGQASTGTAVPLYAMQPGDLVFFHDDLSHVGLCTGNGMMIHAPGPGAAIREESIYPTGESIIRGAIRPV